MRMYLFMVVLTFLEKQLRMYLTSSIKIQKMSNGNETW